MQSEEKKFLFQVRELEKWRTLAVIWELLKNEGIMKLWWQDAWKLGHGGQQRPGECGCGGGSPGAPPRTARIMLDRSSFSCLATFFHFNPAPLSVSSLSKDSWVIKRYLHLIQEKMPVKSQINLQCSFHFLPQLQASGMSARPSDHDHLE